MGYPYKYDAVRISPAGKKSRYMQPEWKERKRWQRLREAEAEAPLSIEQMLEDGVDVPYFGPTVEQIVMLKMVMEELHRAMEQLAPDEKALMEMIGSGIPDREISRKTGIPRSTFIHRKKMLLRDLKNKIVNNL